MRWAEALAVASPWTAVVAAVIFGEYREVMPTLGVAVIATVFIGALIDKLRGGRDIYG